MNTTKKTTRKKVEKWYKVGKDANGNMLVSAIAKNGKTYGVAGGKNLISVKRENGEVYQKVETKSQQEKRLANILLEKITRVSTL